MDDSASRAKKKLRILEIIYRWYDEIALASGPWACEPGCDACCTSSVIMTTLEAAFLRARHSPSPPQTAKAASIGASAPSLALTCNEHAHLCISKEDFIDPEHLQTEAPCPLLENGRCSCYGGRPLMCRVMFSEKRCERTGAAQMPSPLLSLNTVCLQLVEHVDRDGMSGYLVHLLPEFQSGGLFETYMAGTGRTEDARFRPNRPNPGVLAPPEHQEQVRRWLGELYRRLGNLQADDLMGGG